MKVTQLSKKDKSALADLVEHPDAWKALQNLMAQRQLELAMIASMQQDMESLKKCQGQIEEARWVIDQLRLIHKRNARSTD